MPEYIYKAILVFKKNCNTFEIYFLTYCMTLKYKHYKYLMKHDSIDTFPSMIYMTDLLSV